MTAIRLAALTAALAATASLAPAAPQPAEGKNVLQCDGAFARDSSHAKLVQSFGKSSVAFTDIDDAEGEKVKASVIYPDEPRRRVEILWHTKRHAAARPPSGSASSRSGAPCEACVSARNSPRSRRSTAGRSSCS